MQKELMINLLRVSAKSMRLIGEKGRRGSCIWLRLGAFGTEAFWILRIRRVEVEQKKNPLEKPVCWKELKPRSGGYLPSNASRKSLGKH